jgi:hypothetical protein
MLVVDSNGQEGWERQMNNVQGVLEVFVDFHDRGLVTAAVAVVGCCWDELEGIINAYTIIRGIPEKIVTTLRSWLQL